MARGNVLVARTGAMTLAEFRQRKDHLPCHRCGVIGLVEVACARNGGVRPHCSHCGAKVPLPGLMWLPRRPPSFARQLQPELEAFLRRGRGT